MDTKWKSRKLFVWIVITIFVVGCIAGEIFTPNEDVLPDKAIIWLIAGEFIITAIYLLGQALVDFAKEWATKWLEKKMG